MSTSSDQHQLVLLQPAGPGAAQAGLPQRLSRECFFACHPSTGAATGAGAKVLECFLREEAADAAPSTMRNIRNILKDVLWFLDQHELELAQGRVSAFEPLCWMVEGQALFGLAPADMQALRAEYKVLLQRYLHELASRPSRMACYRQEAAQAPTVSHASLLRYLTVIRRFFAFVEERWGLQSPAARLKAPASPTGQRRRQRNQRLSDDQAARLLEYADSLPATVAGRRDRAILYLLLFSGRRTVELARADVRDLAVEGGRRVLYYQGKGHASKDLFTVLHPEAASALDSYLLLRGAMHDGAPLFPSCSDRSRGQRLATRSISYVVKEALKAIGLAEANVFTAHGLRRTFTSHLCDLGVADHDIADARGDSGLGMIRVYRQTQRRLADPAELKVQYRAASSSSHPGR